MSGGTAEITSFSLPPQEANILIQNECTTSVFLNKAAIASQKEEGHFSFERGHV